MIHGAHMIIYTRDPEADRAFFKDVLKWPYVDAQDGWLIFAMPPSELACHPTMANAGPHEIYLMCDDVEALVEKMRGMGHACSPIQDEGWGRLTTLTLPGGGALGIYEPRHTSPLADA